MEMICKKIGIDFHGVLNTSPLFFQSFCELILANEGEVYIISGGPHAAILQFLDVWQIKFTKVWCIYDYFEAKDEIMFLPDGSFHVEDEAWNAAKGNYCFRNNINVMIDDSLIYGKYFTTPYCLYDEYSKKGKLLGKTIDFSADPAQSLERIMKILDSQSLKL